MPESLFETAQTAAGVTLGTDWAQGPCTHTEAGVSLQMLFLLEFDLIVTACVKRIGAQSTLTSC